MKGNLAYLFLEALLKEKGIIRIGGCGGITKNQSNLAGLKILLKKFAEVEVVEGRG